MATVQSVKEKSVKKTEPNITHKIIEDSGMKRQGSNSGVERQLLVQYKGQNYRIYINSESYASQSRVVLSKWTDQSGYQQIIRKGTKNDYGIEISSHIYFDMKRPQPAAFDPIVRDLISIMKKMF